MLAIFQEMALALSFLSVIPAPTVPFTPGRFSRSGRWFPLVGLLLGILLSMAYGGLQLLFPVLLSATLTVALWAILTGGLHLDGLADCCDGLLAPVPTSRRLEIMHDPRVGAFAAIGLFLFLSLKIAALAALSQASAALWLTPVWTRWLILLVARANPASPDGLGAAFAQSASTKNLAIALLVPLALLLWLGIDMQTIGAIVAAHLVCLLLIRMAQQRLGGVTGDVYGLVVEMGELTMLLIFAMQIG